MKVKKNIVLIIASIFLMSCSVADDKTKQNSIANEKELLGAIDKFNSAFRKCNIEQLRSMIIDNYQHTNGKYKSIGKDDWIKYLTKRKLEIEVGDLIVDDYRMEETEIELFDDVAIVTAKITVSSTKNGESLENEYRVTNIWVIENNKWKRAGFHDGKIK